MSVTITRKPTKFTSTAARKKPGANDMGRVTTEALIENYGDLYDVQKGVMKSSEVRRIVVKDALVDTGATLLSMPKKLIKELGLMKCGERIVTTSAGPRTAGMFGPVRLTIMNRFCTMDVMELPNSVPTLIGQIPLEHLDFVIDMRDRKLIGNPAHGGEHIYELY